MQRNVKQFERDYMTVVVEEVVVCVRRAYWGHMRRGENIDGQDHGYM